MRGSVNGYCSEMMIQCRERWTRLFYLLETRLERPTWTSSSSPVFGKVFVFFFEDVALTEIWLARPIWTSSLITEFGISVIFFLRGVARPAPYRRISSACTKK